MTASANPIATHHLPFFITAPGDTDVLYNITVVLVIGSIVLLGVVFLTIHSLPERIAHKSKKVQLDIVAVLCLLALFTNEHVFWVAALLLAYVDIPDFSTPFRRIATAVERMAGQEAAGNLNPAGDSSPDGSKTVNAEIDRPAGESVSPMAKTGIPQIKKGSAHA
jgi:multisubunit Na+/H+ antiporter MnhF subunit